MVWDLSIIVALVCTFLGGLVLWLRRRRRQDAQESGLVALALAASAEELAAWPAGRLTEAERLLWRVHADGLYGSGSTDGQKAEVERIIAHIRAAAVSAASAGRSG